MLDQGRLREVSWQEQFPWLRIVSALRLAFSPSLLALGAIAIFATIAGWRFIAWLYDVEDPWLVVQPPPPVLVIPTEATEIAASPFVYVWEKLSASGRAMFDWTVGWKDFTRYFLGTAWALVVWSLFGAAITRIAAVALARGDRLGFRAGLGHAVRRWPLYFGAPAIPLAGVFAIGLVLLIGGALVHPELAGFGDFMLIVASIFWPLVLIAGLVMALLLIGLLVGWPLMWATISVEATDPFDALSRSYSYAFNRPIRYLFYVIVAAVLGFLGWFVVYLFYEWIIFLSYWGIGWGASAERTLEINEVASRVPIFGTQEATEWDMFRVGATIIGFWHACLLMLALGFIYSYFWSAATAIYYLLRRDEDGTEMSEVAYEDAGEARGLPPLTSDAMGVPAVRDEPPAVSPSPAPPRPLEEPPPTSPGP